MARSRKTLEDGDVGAAVKAADPRQAVRMENPVSDAGAFGHAITAYLSQEGVSQADLARRIGSSRAYVNALASGRKIVSASTIDTIVEAMAASQKDAVGLHRAAARDHGFRLDLPDNF